MTDKNELKSQRVKQRIGNLKHFNSSIDNYYKIDLFEQDFFIKLKSKDQEVLDISFNGNEPLLCAMTDLFIDLISAKKAKDLNNINWREFESFLRDQNHIPIASNEELVRLEKSYFMPLVAGVKNAIEVESISSHIALNHVNFDNLSYVEKVRFLVDEVEKNLNHKLFDKGIHAEVYSLENETLTVKFHEQNDSILIEREEFYKNLSRSLEERFINKLKVVAQWSSRG